MSSKVFWSRIVCKRDSGLLRLIAERCISSSIGEKWQTEELLGRLRRLPLPCSYEGRPVWNLGLILCNAWSSQRLLKRLSSMK